MVAIIWGVDNGSFFVPFGVLTFWRPFARFLFYRKQKRAHGEVIILSVPNRKLHLEVLKREEFVGCIEVFVIFSVAPFDLTVMSGSIRLNEFMADAEFS